MPAQAARTPRASGQRHTITIALAGTTACALVAVAAWASGSRLPSLGTGNDSASPAWLWSSPEATFAHGARLVGFLVASYLAATQFLVGISALVGSVRAQRRFERLSLGLVGRICAATTAGVGTLATLSTPAPAQPEVADGHAPVLRLLEEPAPGAGAGDPPVLRLLPPDGPQATEPPSPVAVTQPTEPGSGPATATPAPQTPTTWVVRPGESFWSIAEEHLGGAHATTDVQAVSQYWLRLIETNRHRLADPFEPDLLFSGQVLDLPPH